MAKAKLSEALKKYICAEVKRFHTILDRRLPESKSKKDILAKVDEIGELIAKL